MITVMILTLFISSDDDKWGVELVPCGDNKKCVSYEDYDKLATYLVSIEDAPLDVQIPAITVDRDKDGRVFTKLADDGRVHVHIGPIHKSVEIDMTQLLTVVETPPKPCPVCVPRWTLGLMPEAGIRWDGDWWFMGCAKITFDLPYGAVLGKWMGLEVGIDPCLQLGLATKFGLSVMVGSWFKFGA